MPKPMQPRMKVDWSTVDYLLAGLSLVEIQTTSWAGIAAIENMASILILPWASL